METFVIRVWTPAEPEHSGGPTLCGLVEHIRDGERRPFEGGRALLEYLEAATAATNSSAPRPGFER